MKDSLQYKSQAVEAFGRIGVGASVEKIRYIGWTLSEILGPPEL